MIFFWQIGVNTWQWSNSFENASNLLLTHKAVCTVCLTCSCAGLRQQTTELISGISLLRNSGCGWCQASCQIHVNPTFYQINLGLRQMLACPGVRKGKGHGHNIITLSYIYFFSFSSSSTGFASCASATRTTSCQPLDLQLGVLVPHRQRYISILSYSINASCLVFYSAWY